MDGSEEHGVRTAVASIAVVGLASSGGCASGSRVAAGPGARPIVAAEAPSAVRVASPTAAAGRDVNAVDWRPWLIAGVVGGLYVFLNEGRDWRRRRNGRGPQNVTRGPQAIPTAINPGKGPSGAWKPPKGQNTV